MPSSPRTPTRAENHINIDSSPYGYSNGYVRSPRSRKSSFYSPATPRPQSAVGTNGIPTMLSDFAGAMDGGNDLGSLADELAEAWEEDVDGEEELAAVQMDEHGGYAPFEPLETQHQEYGNVSSLAHGRTTNGFLSPKKCTQLSKARRRRKDNDGLDYSDDSDREQTDSTLVALEARMTTIENLSRQETDETGAHAGGVVVRVVNGLRDLGAQSSVENGTTRSVLLFHNSPNPRPFLSNSIS